MKRISVQRLATAIVARPWLWVVLALAILLVGATGLRHVSIMPDLRVFFSEENPDKRALDNFERSFVKEDSALIAIEPRDGNVFAPAAIRAVADVVERAWALPYVRRVNAITNFQDSRGDADNLIVTDLIPNPETADAAALTRARARAQGRPEIAGSLLNDDASMTMVRALFVLPGSNPRAELPKVHTALTALVDDIEATHPGVELYLSGTVPMNATFMLAARSDLKTLAPAMLALVLAVTAVSLQMMPAAAMTLAVIVISAVASVGSLAWAGTPLNTATTMAPLIVMTLAVASTTHLLSGVRQAMVRHKGEGRTARTRWVQIALERHMPAIALANATTAMGFLALNFSISPPFQQLGNAVAIGVVTTLVLTLTLLPALVILAPLRRRNRAALIHRTADQLAAQLARRGTVLGLAFLILAVPSAIGLLKLSLEDDFVAYFDETFRFRRDTDYIEQRLTGLRTIEFPVRTGKENGVYSPALLSQVEAFVDWMRSQPHVVAVRTPTDTLKQLNMNMHGDAPEAYRLPEERRAAAQYFLLYEMSLGYGMDLSDRITVDRSAMRLTTTLRDVTTADTRRFEADARAWLDANAPLIETAPTGITHVFTLIAHRDARAMLAGTLLALVGISGVMMLALRDWRLGVVSLAPNLVPAVVAFGLWGHLSGPITLAVSVVAAMTFGIVVDDTVHFLTTYQRLRREGVAPQRAVERTVSTVGGALIATSVSLFLGFMLMSTSGFAVNGDMAKLSGLTIAVALAADLLLLPMFLTFTRPYGQALASAPLTRK